MQLSTDARVFTTRDYRLMLRRNIGFLKMNIYVNMTREISFTRSKYNIDIKRNTRYKEINGKIDRLINACF